MPAAGTTREMGQRTPRERRQMVHLGLAGQGAVSPQNRAPRILVLPLHLCRFGKGTAQPDKDRLQDRTKSTAVLTTKYRGSDSRDVKSDH